ncbi:MAG: tetratricopeptide repeat protein [Zoogloea sp.]|nr:tetratricopeptide repeat protein [Zoogloea sp.]
MINTLPGSSGLLKEPSLSDVCIFLSCVSAEFRLYREELRRYLSRPNVAVKVQEDFIVTGGETLEMLDDYIRRCDVVIHLVGNSTGAMAQAPSVAAIHARYPDFGERLPLEEFLGEAGPPLSYTQWEAWLALYHGRRLIIATPADDDDERDEGRMPDPAQQAHLARLELIERYPGIRFRSPIHFAAEVWRSGLLDILIGAGLVRRIVHLPYKSLGTLFKGRDVLFEDLALYLGPVPQGQAQPTKVVALTGMGGVGKTRLALEYAWRQADACPVRLLVGADSADALSRNLAALCSETILDLPEQAETDEGKQNDAVLRWLNQHVGWLLILDNIDTEAAAVAVEALLPRLSGGHVLMTSRLPNWSAGIKAVPVDLLSPDASVEFLLSRTSGRRRQQADDPLVAARLTEELGCLALGLEQAGAYIAQRRSTFGQYLAQWQCHRDEVLSWFDERLMQYPRSIAITWQTSFDQLGSPARRLLQHLAWFAPEPIPETLLDIPSLGQSGLVADLHGAMVELDAFSLVMRATDAPFFEVHRLVQEVTRSDLRQGDEHSVLVEALRWVNAAFVGDPVDVHSWTVLEPLVLHARAVAVHADLAGITDPTAHLMNQVSLLLLEKAAYAEAEPLLRRALAIGEASFGTEKPEFAIHLNNLAQLLKATNRLDEAEPLMRRALKIDEARLGSGHREVAVDLNNLAQLLKDRNELAEAELLMRRALVIARVIDEAASFGTGHPPVISGYLSNLAVLLFETRRTGEAESLMREALELDEAHFGPEHPLVANRLSNLASILHASHRLDEAGPLMHRALAIFKEKLGASHHRVAILLNNLADLLMDTNQLTDAEPLMREALVIVEETFGSSHPRVAIQLNNLGALLKKTNRWIEAESLLRRALIISVKSSGIDHPSTRTVHRNYIELLEALGRTDDEIEHELTALIPGDSGNCPT